MYSIDQSILRDACEFLSPAHKTEKGETTRIKRAMRDRIAAELTGISDRSIRKYRKSGGKSVIQVEDDTIHGFIAALETELKKRPADDTQSRAQYALKKLVDLREQSHHPAHAASDPHYRYRVINLGFVRSGRDGFVEHLEAGFRAAAGTGLSDTHVLNDAAVDVFLKASDEENSENVCRLLERMNFDAPWVDVTYLVPIGTQAAKALRLTVTSNPRWTINGRRKVLFLGLTDPDETLQGLDRDHICGFKYGLNGRERLQCIVDTFPDAPLAFVYYPDADQDVIMHKQIDACLEIAKDLKVYPVREGDPLLPEGAEQRLVFGYYYVNEYLAELVQQYKDTPFVGLNIADLGRGAVISTGNDDLANGKRCAKELLVDVVQRSIPILEPWCVVEPQPVFGMNVKACQRYALTDNPQNPTRYQLVVG